MEIVKGSLSELKHDFNGNIRNQKNIIQEVTEVVENGEEVDGILIESVIEVKKRMNELWDKVLLMLNENK